jgi:hypothetical protein
LFLFGEDSDRPGRDVGRGGERGEVNRDALYKMPNQEATTYFAKKVITKKATEPHTAERQIFIADLIIEKGKVGAGSINANKERHL